MLQAASLAHLQPCAKFVTMKITGLILIQMRPAFAKEAISERKTNVFDVLHKFKTVSNAPSRESVLSVPLIMSFRIIAV